MRWTIEEERSCLRMIRAGMTYDEIGETLGRNSDSIAHYVHWKRKKEPGIWRKIGTKGMPKRQLCETCYYASGAIKNGFKCPWADRFEPVEGWDASPTRKRNQYGKTFVYVDSYIIRVCPHYEEG